MMFDPTERTHRKEIIWTNIERFSDRHEPARPEFHRDVREVSESYRFTPDEMEAMGIEAQEWRRREVMKADVEPDLAAVVAAAEPFLEEEEIELLILISRGKSHGECAQVLGWPKGSVDYRLQRAIRIARAGWHFTELATAEVRATVIAALPGNSRVIWQEYVAGVPLDRIADDFEAVHPPDVIGVPGRHHFQFVRSAIRIVGQKLRSLGLGGYVEAAEDLRKVMSAAGRGNKTRMREAG